PIEILISAFKQRVLMPCADSAARILAVLAVERIGGVQSFDDFAERHEPLIVLIRVVAQADVDLRRAPVWILERKRDASARIGHLSWIVGNRLGPPARRNCWFAVDSELRPLALDDPEEAGVVEVARG